MPAARLALLHVHQRTAPLDARERLSAIVSAAAPRADLVAVLTCHRVEVYAAIPTDADPLAAMAERLASDDPVLEHAVIRTDDDAARHLFRVSCGLDSAIVGEGQIANQVRRAHEDARTRGIDPILAAAFQRALHLARAVRATTPLGAVRRSIGSLAVDAALGRVAEPARATALVVGAGEIGKLAARALARRVRRLIVANRDAARGAELAGPIGADAVGLEGLAAALARADVVISAADSRGTVLTRELLEPRAAARPLVVVDIAVPRSVAEDARELPGLAYRDVDDLASDVSGVPGEVLAEVERRCADAADAYIAWLAERGAAGAIKVLRDEAEAIRRRHLGRAMRRLGHLNERDREVVASLAASLTNALVHEPTIRLREARR